MKKNIKISSTAYRVLLIKRLLAEQDLNIDEILTFLSEDARIGRSFTKEAVLKYIHTLRASGIILVKKAHKYSMRKSYVKYDLTLENIKTLAVMDSYVKNLHQSRMIELYQSFLTKLKKLLSEEQINLLEKEINKQSQAKKFNFAHYNEYAELIQQYEKYCFEDLRVKVFYKLPTEEEIKTVVLEPKSVKYTLNNIYLSGYNPYEGEKQLLLINYVKEIKQLPQKSRHTNVSFAITFKLKERLAKGYKLYEGEKILETNEDNSEITVTNNSEDKNALFKRLLRYGDKCEILQPKSERNNFANIIKATLNNYK